MIGLVEQFPTVAADDSVKVLVERSAPSPFDLSGVAERAELVETDLPVTALHRVAALRRLLGGLDAGVLYSPYHAFTPLAASCPVVSAVHDCIWEENPAYAGGRARQLAFLGLSWACLQRTSAVVVPSRATAQALTRYYPRVAGTVVIPNGVGLPRPGTGTAATVEQTRSALDLPRLYLLHIGARRPHKNQVLLLDMLARLDPSVSLVLVGRRDPRMRDDVDERIHRLGLRDRVRVIDSVDDQHLPALYGGAAAFVFPSLVEGYGIPPLEAMAAGTPVVASAIPVLAEVCQQAASLVSPFDLDGWVSAVERILTDPAATDQKVMLGRDVARRSGWARGGAALHELLRRVADGPPVVTSRAGTPAGRRAGGPTPHSLEARRRPQWDPERLRGAHRGGPVPPPEVDVLSREEHPLPYERIGDAAAPQVDHVGSREPSDLPALRPELATEVGVLEEEEVFGAEPADRLEGAPAYDHRGRDDVIDLRGDTGTMVGVDEGETVPEGWGPVRQLSGDRAERHPPQ